MLQFQPWKVYSIIAACLLSAIISLPNFLSAQTVRSWPAWFPRAQVPLGLDLRGGAHLLLSMSEDEVMKTWLATIRDDTRKRMLAAKIGFESRPAIVGKAVQVRPVDAKEADKAVTELKKMIQPLTSGVLVGFGPPDLDVRRDESGLVTIRPTEAALKDKIGQAISAAIETVRRRVDPAGTTEPMIVRQGVDRILVQVPGVDNTEELKKRIGETARLTLHLVHQTKTAEEVAATGQVPAGYKVYPTQDGKGKLLLAEPAISGEMVTNAQPGTSGRTGEAAVTFQLNRSGGAIFGTLTRENVGKPFAIVLDDKVLSAPRINEPILGGSAEITGDFTLESATRLAIQLRSGALPAKLTVIEERTVGPSLGADSIEAGMRAGMIGAIVTFIMTIVAYGTFGLFAVVSLIINGFMILAIMTLFGSTLTLPGIAGLVLTVGMAVDSNVLIYERIREELRSGKSAIAAIEEGFRRAIITIADSQLTTLASAIIMFWLGSGPIRGFAVTLSIGIFTSVFTAVTVTRLLVAWWLSGACAIQRKIDVPI